MHVIASNSNSNSASASASNLKSNKSNKTKEKEIVPTISEIDIDQDNSLVFSCIQKNNTFSDKRDNFMSSALAPNDINEILRLSKERKIIRNSLGDSNTNMLSKESDQVVFDRSKSDRKSFGIDMNMDIDSVNTSCKLKQSDLFECNQFYSIPEHEAEYNECEVEISPTKLTK